MMFISSPLSYYHSVSEAVVFITYLTVNAKAANPITTIRFVMHDWKLLGWAAAWRFFWFSRSKFAVALRCVSTSWKKKRMNYSVITISNNNIKVIRDLECTYQASYIPYFNDNTKFMKNFINQKHPSEKKTRISKLRSQKGYNKWKTTK